MNWMLYAYTYRPVDLGPSKVLSLCTLVSFGCLSKLNKTHMLSTYSNTYMILFFAILCNVIRCSRMPFTKSMLLQTDDHISTIDTPLYMLFLFSSSNMQWYTDRQTYSLMSTLILKFRQIPSFHRAGII